MKNSQNEKREKWYEAYLKWLYSGPTTKGPVPKLEDYGINSIEGNPWKRKEEEL